MDDTIDYRQMVLAEVVTALGTGPDVTMDQIETRLGTLYAQHEHAKDQQGMTLISEAWGHIQTVANAADSAVGIAAAAREIAAQMMGQRDAVLEQHEALKTALKTNDYHHPVVAIVMQNAEEMVEERIAESGAYITADPAIDIIEIAEIPVSEDDARLFHACLCGERLFEHLDIDTASELGAQLGALIEEFVEKVRLAEAENVYE